MPWPWSRLVAHRVAVAVIVTRQQRAAELASSAAPPAEVAALNARLADLTDRLDALLNRQQHPTVRPDMHRGGSR